MRYIDKNKEYNNGKPTFFKVGLRFLNQEFYKTYTNILPEENIDLKYSNPLPINSNSFNNKIIVIKKVLKTEKGYIEKYYEITTMTEIEAFILTDYARKLNNETILKENRGNNPVFIYRDALEELKVYPDDEKYSSNDSKYFQDYLSKNKTPEKINKFKKLLETINLKHSEYLAMFEIEREVLFNEIQGIVSNISSKDLELETSDIKIPDTGITRIRGFLKKTNIKGGNNND